jgi:hypothetical protein
MPDSENRRIFFETGAAKADLRVAIAAQSLKAGRQNEGLPYAGFTLPFYVYS